MISNTSISKVLTMMNLLFFLMLYLNHTYAKRQPDIFSITGNNVLWRKVKFASNDNLTNFNNSTSMTENKLTNYLSLMSNESNELNEIAEQSFKEDSIPLPSAYIELSTGEIKFHDMIYDDFASFKSWPVKLETVIPDGFEPNTVKITYENKISALILTGSADINGTDYNLIVNISEVIFKTEHERTALAEGKILTKSIFEKLTFKKFKITMVLLKMHKCVEFPNKKILRRLADTWMVTLVNVINIRFVRPRITDQSRLYFEKYKNILLEDIGSLIRTLAENATNFSSDQSASMKLAGSLLYEQYQFEDITFSSFSKFSNCTSKATSLKLDTNSLNEDVYSHNLLFVFTDNSNAKNSPPFIQWIERRIKFGEYGYNYNYINPDTWSTSEKLNHTCVIKYWSALISVFTDILGRKTEETKVSIDIRPENYSEAESNYWINQFFSLFSRTMASNLKSLIDSSLF